MSEESDVIEPGASYPAKPRLNIARQRHVVRPAPLSPPPRTVPTDPDGHAHPLPHALWSRVFRRLPAADLARCQRVCRTWCRWAAHPALWTRVNAGRRSLTAHALAGVVRRQPRELKLDWTNVSREQLSWLLARIPRMRRLSLDGCAWAALATPLTDVTCPLLAALSLAWVSGLHDSAVRRLCTPPSPAAATPPPAALDVTRPRLYRLRRLSLAGCDVSDAAMRHLAAGMPRLTELDVSYCVRLSDQAPRLLIGSDTDKQDDSEAVGLRRLERLDLTGCAQLSEAALVCINQWRRLRCVVIASCSGMTETGVRRVLETQSDWSFNIQARTVTRRQQQQRGEEQTEMGGVNRWSRDSNDDS